MLFRTSLIFVLLAAGQILSAETSLERYVKTPDATYKWAVVSSAKGPQGVTITLVDMKSQTWRTTADVVEPVWQHYMNIYTPAQVKSKIGMLFISGGSRGNQPRPDAMLQAMANDTGIVITELRNVPNQPFKFVGDTDPRYKDKGRSEDEMIAYTWDKFLQGGDDLWPARLPMTKAAVRAMDTTTAFLKSAEGGGKEVNQFIVAGASKRGWTTWTTAIVDPRVVAIAPLVIDLLNIEASFEHHWRAYGFWAPAIGNYTDMRLPDWFGTKRFKELMKIVEPYEYRSRLTMPKLIMNSAGDDFFLPDSSQFYYSKLSGEKHLRYVPNTRHNLASPDVPQSLTAFVDSIVNNRPRQDFSWKLNKSDGSLQVQSKEVPKEVKVWQVTNPKARDFRLTTTGAKWTSQTVTLTNGRYKTSVANPPSGYTAFFVEMTYDSGGKYPHKFTTEVSVVPRTYPFPKPKPGDGLPPKK
jgi:PhoPQ-activated pathogenicity-related protein